MDLKKKLYFFVLLFLVFCAACSVNKDVHGQNVKKYDLYLLVGQSNMAGRGLLEVTDTTVHKRVFSLNAADQFVPAKEPLHFDKKGRGTGPGLAFGKVMATANAQSFIGLIPAAVGGTKISYWEPGNPKGLFEEAIRKAKIAMQSGQLKGILWQQGESDSNAEDAPLYKERLLKLLQSFRNELGAKDVPIVIGGLGSFLKSPQYKNINVALVAVANEIGNAKFSEASNLGHIGDSLHFNSKAQRENGQRMAIAMLQLQQK